MVRETPAARADHQTRILDAAAEVFLENGFEKTSTAEIARRATVSKRELYAHFGDKRDLLAAVITQLQEEIQSQVGMTWSSSDDVRTVLTRVGNELLRFIRSERFGKLLRIVAAESFHDPVSARRFYLLGPAMGREKTAAYLKRQMAVGNLRRADPLRAADDFLDLVVGARHLTAVVLGQDREVRRPRAHVNHAVEMFLRFYGADRD